MNKLTDDVISRIDARIIEVTSAGCYLTNHTGKRDNIHIDNKTYIITRITYAIHYNADPGDLVVCHTCDHPNCINPLHLYLGTQGDNLKDRARKGRAPDQKGTKSVLSVIKSDDAIRSIRYDYAMRRVTMKSLAVKHGVSEDTIRRILRYESYTNVENDDDYDSERIKARITQKLGTKSRKAKKAEINGEIAAQIDALRAKNMTIRRISHELQLYPRDVQDYIIGRTPIAEE